MAIKFLSTVICYILLVAANDDNASWSAEEENCIDELKLDKPKIQILRNKAITPYSDSDFNSFLSCYWKKKGAQDENGELNWESVDKILEDFMKPSADVPYLVTVGNAMISKLNITKCRLEYKQEDTHGKTVAKFLNCVSEKNQAFLKSVENERSRL